MGELEDIRNEIDQFMKHHPQSPIEPDDRDDFDGLQYYSPNPDLRFEVEIQRLAEDEPAITMQTSTGDEQEFRRWGRFSFEVAGEIATLTIYSNPDGHDFFLPFRDSTNGSETYGAGRYMDEHRPGIERLADGRILVDFNYAYNPYCAYSPYYSCPLPPRENWLQIPIRAGEKNFGQK